MKKNRITIYVGPALSGLIDEKAGDGGSVSGVLNAVADRYDEVVKRALKKLEFTVDEWLLIFDAMNGVMTTDTAQSIAWQHAGVIDAAGEDGLAEKYGVDTSVLKEKFARMDFCGHLAMTDTSERFWVRFGGKPSPREDIEAWLKK